MLRLHLSLAAARSATVNGTGPGQSLSRAPGAPLPARFSPICGGESMLRRGTHAGGEAGARRKCVENGEGGSVPGEKGEGGSMVKKEQSPGASGRICADAEETQADESDHSGYDTAAGYSDFYESYSECAESPPINGGTGREDCAGDLRSCLDSPVLRKEPALNLGDESSCSSVMLWDRPQPCSSEEAHYITTHEIQLYELDHDGECELGSGWDTEESSACSCCRESSSFESEESEASSRTPLGASYAGDPPPPATGAVSPGLPVKGVRSASPLENGTEDGSCGGRLQVSIRADSQSVSEGNGAQERGKTPLTNSLGSGNQHITKPQAAGDLVKGANSCHNTPASAGAKSNWKAFGNSSGTSSAVSELDDADKEVRSLTARTFRSLACAGDEYLDTFSAGYRTSIDLSEENTALNRCATYIDLKSRSITTGKKGRVGFPTKGANLDTAQGGREQRATGSEAAHLPVPGVAVTANEKQETEADKSTSKRQLHLSGKFEQIGSKVITLTETLNFRYDVKEQGPARREGERRVHLAGGVVGLRCTDEVTESALGEEGGESSRESSKPAEAMDGAQKKSKFASNLLQNVIGKKMQFEQELKMERGEISDTSFAGPTSPPAAEFPKAPPPSRDVQPNSNGGSSENSPLPEEATGEAAPCETRPATGDSGDGCKSTLHRSQQSAFRSWKDSEPPAPTRESKPAQRVRAEIGGHPLCKETKMSHLFVPSIQKAPGRRQPAVNVTYTTEGQQRPADGEAEIRIQLGEAKGGRQSPFSIAKLLTPNIAGGASSLGKAASDGRCPALPASPRAEGARVEDARARAPPFTVRDVRDTMHKLQAPIHQVRDVRKLVKSSYHVSTLDGGGPGGEPAAEQPRGSGSLLPIVIKCQAFSRKEGPGPEDGSSPAAMKNGSAFVQRTSGRVPLKEATGVGGPPAASSSQLALEKLTAAVRSMEQLYVFDNNEWRRKSGQGPGPLAGSHVLSLIASQEASDSGAPPGGAEPRVEQEQLPANPPAAARYQARALPKPPSGGGVRAAVPQLFVVAPVAPQPLPQGDKPTVGGKAGVGSPHTPDPRPSRAQPRQTAEESEKLSKPGAAVQAAGSQEKPPLPPEHENYLTIPVKKPPAAPREPSPPAVYQPQHAQFIRLTPPVLEPLSPGKVQPVPPVLMDSPSVPCFPVPQTQRRMLLDPATGQYYLVDTPVQPARRRLYDPETGQYVDIPMPQQPVAPMPMQMSPMAISPGTYGPTYMIYPGFLPQPTVLPTLPYVPDTECSETKKGSSAPRLQPEPQYLESPYYFPTGKSLSGSQTTSRGCKGLSDGKPVISITSQQGPRIIAPPSFDGTTMSFVVEHR